MHIWFDASKIKWNFIFRCWEYNFIHSLHAVYALFLILLKLFICSFISYPSANVFWHKQTHTHKKHFHCEHYCRILWHAHTHTHLESNARTKECKYLPWLWPKRVCAVHHHSVSWWPIRCMEWTIFQIPMKSAKSVKYNALFYSRRKKNGKNNIARIYLEWFLSVQ